MIAKRMSWLALILSIGGLGAALIAAFGTGTAAWPFATGFLILRYALYAALTGAALAILAFVMARRSGIATGRLNLLALLIALLFAGYLLSQIAAARSVPAIHDLSTDLSEVPAFRTLKVRADNLANIPGADRAEFATLDAESRWAAIHRQAYGDLRSLRLPARPAEILARAEALARSRGWEVAKVDANAGTLEATATSLFFRFKDDVVVRVRGDPANPGGTIVDMRSISRVGTSDIGVNAKRIRAFLADLKSA